MITKQWTLSLLFILFISNQIWGQSPEKNYSIKEEVIDLKKGRPVFDELKRIIGGTELIRDSKSNFIDFENRNFRHKIKLNSGKEFEIDELLQNTIYLEKANRIITFGRLKGGHTMSIALTVFMYDLNGKLINKITPFDSSSNSDIHINKEGEVYLVGRYDKDYQNQYLLKVRANGSFWKQKLPLSFAIYDILKLRVSPDSRKIAILQNRLMDNFFPNTNISIYDTSGVLVTSFPNKEGLDDISFWDENEVVIGSKDVYCMVFYDYILNMGKGFKCFNNIVIPSYEFPLKLLKTNSKEKYFLAYQKGKNELLLFSINDKDSFSISRKIKIDEETITKANSIVLLNKKIEIYSTKKKTIIEF